MNADNSTRSHLAGLNGLRALACLGVFAVHFQQKTSFQGNWSFLDFGALMDNRNTALSVFYILSGFLMSLSYWSGQRTSIDATWLQRYVLRRFSRIVPVYYLCLTLLVIRQQHWSSMKDLADTVLHYLFLHNYTEFSFYGISDPFWAISTWAQLYMLFPIFLLLLHRFDPRGKSAFLLVLALALASLLLQQAFTSWAASNANPWPLPKIWVHPHGVVISKSLLSHLPVFTLGIALGRVFTALQKRCHSHQASTSKYCEIAFWSTSFAVLYLLTRPLDQHLPLALGRYNFPLIPILIATILVTASLSPVACALLECFPLKKLGLISYSFYLLHVPIQGLTAKLMSTVKLDISQHWIAFGCVSLAMTVLVATCSYLIVERPILRTVDRAT